MKTTYFWKAEHEPIHGTKYVSIASGNMQHCNFPVYKDLCQSWNIIKMVHTYAYTNNVLKIYKEEYYKQLMKLDPNKIYEDLMDCTLVYYEPSKDLASGKKFCHRRMVAGWLENTIGIVVSEETREKENNLIIPAIYL